MKNRKTLLFAGTMCATLLFSLGPGSPGTAAAASAPAPFPESITLTKVASGFQNPTTIAHAGDGSNRLFILEQKGTIRIIRNGATLPTPFLDITKLVRSGGEQGLLGIAFAPDFAKRRTFWINYTNKRGIGNTVVARYSVSTDPDRADPGSAVKVLGIVQPFRNHNGGQLAFGPDRHLYIGTGDGGSGGDPFHNGQNTKTKLGKLLRLDVLSGASPYALPNGNPFGNEVWAYGLRNPWRFSFDRETGDLYIADVGQNKIEEIDFLPAGAKGGANFGWNAMEGSRCFAKSDCNSKNFIGPVAEYNHDNGDCSITGGYVYRGKQAALKGIYFFGDYCSGRIWGLRKNGGKWETKLLKESKLAISTFGEDEQGEIYVADHGGGAIYRISAP